jgi:mannosyltransferase
MSPASGPPRTAWILAAVLAGLHVVVKARGLGENSLWLDEAVAVHLAQLDWAGIVTASRGDTTPPLYYLVLGASERLLGISESAVRWPSVLASSATAAALFLLAWRWLGRFAAYVVAALFLVSDVHLAFAREARPYALAALLCVLSFGLLLEALHRASWWPWIALAVVNALMVFTHYVTLFAVAAQALALAGWWRGGGALRRHVLVHLPVAGLLVAWVIPLLTAGEHRKMGWLEVPTVLHVAKLLGWYTGGHRGFPGFLVLLVGTVLSLRAARARGDAVPWPVVPVVALWAFAPPLLAFVVSNLGILTFHPRYLLYASCGMMLLWALGAQALPAGRWRAVGTGVACLVAALGFGRSAQGRTPDWRGAAAVARAHPGRNIVLVPWWELKTFAYYYDRAAFRDAARTSALVAADGVRTLYHPRDPAALEADTPEVLVVSLGPASAAEPVERTLATRGFEPVERLELRGVAVVRLARGQGGAR